MVRYAVIQTLIIVLACVSFGGREQANDVNTIKTSFYPDDVTHKKTVAFIRHSQSDITITIVHNSNRYLYQDECDHGWMLREELLDELSKSYLYISYMKDSNKIVDIKSDTKVYYTIDDYNAEQTRQIVLGVVAIALIEIFFLVWVLLYIGLYAPKRGFLRKRKGGGTPPPGLC